MKLKTLSLITLVLIGLTSCGDSSTPNESSKQKDEVKTTPEYTTNEVSKAYTDGGEDMEIMDRELFIVSGKIKKITKVPIGEGEYNVDLEVDEGMMGVQVRLSSVYSNADKDLTKMEVGQEVRMKGSSMGINHMGYVAIINCELLD